MRLLSQILFCIYMRLLEHFPCRIVFSIWGRPALFWSPSGPIWSWWPRQRQAATCFPRLSTGKPAVYQPHSPMCTDPPPQAPLGAAFVADSIWFHRTWKRTRDTWHCPPISHVQDHLQTALRGSPGPTTPNRRPHKHHCLHRACLFPADLPEKGEMWKVRDKLASTEGGELSCTERKEIPLWDFIFFPSSSSKKKKKNTKRLSVLNGNVGFKSLRFGLTLQKKKKSDRLSDMTQKKFFPSIHVAHL